VPTPFRPLLAGLALAAGVAALAVVFGVARWVLSGEF